MRSFLLILLLSLAQTTQALQLEIGPAQLKNMAMDDQGFLKNLGSDGYLSFRGLQISRAQACTLKLDLEFKKPMQRPGIFEIFWHGPGQGFSEQTKAFVLINQADTASRMQFLIPLCKLYHFSGNLNQASRQGAIAGLRIDYPSNRTIAIKMHSIELLAGLPDKKLITAGAENIRLLEPYERIDPRAFTSLDVVLPKLYFAAQEGAHRLWQDKAFLIFWLLLIGGFKLLIIRSYLRKN